MSISIDLIEMQLTEIVKLEKSYYTLKIQHPSLALHKFSIEAFRKCISGSL